MSFDYTITHHNFNEIYRHLASMLLLSKDEESQSQTIVNKSKEVLFELVNPQLILTNPTNCFAICREMSLEYLRGEISFYLSGSDRVEDISKYSQFWEKVADNGIVNSNYGKLLFHDRNDSGFTQFSYAKAMLLRNRESKKAVMTIYAPSNSRYSNDNPCTMFLQFIIRKNRLHLFVKMRSSDIWFGMPYDVPFFVMVQHMMLLALSGEYADLRVGHYHHQSTSLHLYSRNADRLQSVLKKSWSEHRCRMTGLCEEKHKEQSDLFSEYIMRTIYESDVQGL